MLKRNVAALRQKWQILREQALELTARSDGSPECKAAWKRFFRVDKKLYRHDQREFMKRWKQLSVEPYGMFDTIPSALKLLVERFDEYWRHGYNIHIVDTDQHIGKSAAEAVKLGDKVSPEDLYNGVVSFEEYRAALAEFLNYVADHCWDWGD